MTKRKTYTPQQKVSILRKHLVEKAPVSQVCEEYNLRPTVFYRWQQEFFENGAAAFEKRHPAREKRLEEQIEVLQGKVRKKDEVLGELLEEHIALKKSLGEL